MANVGKFSPSGSNPKRQVGNFTASSIFLGQAALFCAPFFLKQDAEAALPLATLAEGTFLRRPKLHEPFWRIVLVCGFMRVASCTFFQSQLRARNQWVLGAAHAELETLPVQGSCAWVLVGTV